MPLGQFTPGQTFVTVPTVFDQVSVHNRGVKAGTGFGTPTAASGTAAGFGAISAQVGTDFAGHFTVTGAGVPLAGTLVTVTFANPLTVAPTGVVANVADNAGSTALAAGTTSLSTSGFVIESTATTAAHTYTVNYVVIQ